MNENGEKSRPGIEIINMDKEVSTTLTLGKNGPEITVIPDSESESGISVIYNGETIKLHLGLNTIGRHESSDVLVNIPTVSRTHATIRVSDKEYSISDSGSTNGTYLA